MRKNLLDRGVDSPAEITQFQNIETVKNVLRLDIPMNDTMTMQIPDPRRHLSEIKGSQILLQVTFLSDFLKQTPVGGQF